MARVFITGSADGLGLAAARRLLAEGHRIVVHVRARHRLPAVQDLVARGAVPVIGDIADLEQTFGVADQVNALGQMDAVIHSESAEARTSGGYWLHQPTRSPSCSPRRKVSGSPARCAEQCHRGSAGMKEREAGNTVAVRSACSACCHCAGSSFRADSGFFSGELVLVSKAGILTALGNLLPVLPEEETYLALFQGARRVATDCDGEAPRRERAANFIERVQVQE